MSVAKIVPRIQFKSPWRDIDANICFQQLARFSAP